MPERPQSSSRSTTCEAASARRPSAERQSARGRDRRRARFRQDPPAQQRGVRARAREVPHRPHRLLAFSKDGATMGFAYPKDWRRALVESEPEKYSLPSEHDMRYHWAHVCLAAIDSDEMRELVEDAWAFCVPKRVAEEYAAAHDYR